MATAACLRILANAADHGRSGELDRLIGKVTSAFLDSRWVWPRRHGRVGFGAFLLTDPRAAEFDANELRSLAQELELKLFGVERTGEVVLLLFEGEPEEIIRFSNCEPDELRAMLNGGSAAPPLSGRLRRVTSDGASPPLPLGAANTHDAHDAPISLRERLPRTPQRARPTIGFHAVYHASRGNIVGSGLSDGRQGAQSMRRVFTRTGLIRGEAARLYDQGCITASVPTLLAPFNGLLFYPLSFSELLQRQTRELYLPTLDLLPAGRIGQLAAAVYDVPRAPSFAAMSQLTDFLRKYFGFIDLQVIDPAFEVETLPAGTIDSVTFVPPEGESKARLPFIRRFMERRELYQRVQVWPAISGIRRRAELDFCLAQRTPFVSGPAVSDLLDEPAPVGPFRLADLPVRRPGEPALMTEIAYPSRA